MADWYMRQGDTKPDIEVTLKDGDGVVVNVAGASIEFHMKNAAGTVVIATGSVTLTDGANGVVTYPWQDGDTATAGLFEAEFEVSYAGDAGVETFPNSQRPPFIVEIARQIA